MDLEKATIMELKEQLTKTKTKLTITKLIALISGTTLTTSVFNFIYSQVNNMEFDTESLIAIGGIGLITLVNSMITYYKIEEKCFNLGLEINYREHGQCLGIYQENKKR